MSPSRLHAHENSNKLSFEGEDGKIDNAKSHRVNKDFFT